MYNPYFFIRKLKDNILVAYFWLRLPVLKALKIIFRFKPAKTKSLNKFLIIRLDRIGDFVLSLPVIANIRLRYPNATINVLVRPYLKELAELIEDIDNVIIYDGFIPAARRISRDGYDAVFDLVYDYRAKPAFLAYLTKAPARLGFSWGFRELFFNYIVNPGDHPYKDMSGLHLELLKTIHIPVKATVPKISLEGAVNTGEPLIAIHPCGYYESQRWGADKFVILGNKIIQYYGVNLALVGALSDKTVINYITGHIGSPKARSVMGTIKDLAFTLKNSCLLVCNNSGPMHLAAAIGTPTISIMGPANPLLWWPRGENNIVIRKDLECSPCSKGRCIEHKCMDLVSVEEVFEKVKLVMSKLGIEGG